MVRTVKIKTPNGALVEAKSMDFETIEEKWNLYKLSDGTLMRLKTTPLKIYQLEITDPVTGQHQYFIQHDTIVAASEPEK